MPSHFKTLEFENIFITVDKPVGKLWRLTVSMNIHNKAHAKKDEE